MTNGERELEELEELGGGRGRVVMSWRERVSRIATELPAEKARRPEGLRSADPKLLRLGGPGSMQSNESWTAACAAVTAVDGVAGLGLNIAPLFSVSGIPRERNAGFDLI